MFNNHIMTVVTDLSTIGPAILDREQTTVAAITTSDFPEYPNIYNASVLMPPTQCLMDWANGLPYALQYEYPRYLYSLDPDEMIVALLAALTRSNVYLYIPSDEFRIFGVVLLNHIYFNYGIQCYFVNTPFYVNETKIPLIISKFYMMGLMEPTDFLSAYPANAPLPTFVVQKLAEDMHPFDRPVPFSEYEKYFNFLNRSKDPEMKRMIHKVTKSEGVKS